MPTNGFSVGKDVTVDLVIGGQNVRFSLITGFESAPEYSEPDVIGLDGITRYLVLPTGWKGKMDFERQGPQLDTYFAEREAAYFAGQDLPSGTITETIQEPDGGVSQFRYEGAVLMLEDAGSKKGLESVKQSVSWKASRRIQVS